MKKSSTERNGEAGFASLIISVVLVIVLSLITVGFAALMRSEQQSALDRQLNNEAYYAAESGINDASTAIYKGYDVAKTACAPLNLAQVTSSNNPAAAAYLENNHIDDNAGTSYPCLLINPTPTTLKYGSVAVGQTTTAIVTGVRPDNPSADQAINQFEFSWQDANGSRQFNAPGCGLANTSSTLPPAASWSCGGNAITGVLRVSITPLPNGGPLDDSTLEQDTYTAFLYPTAGDGSTKETPYYNNIGQSAGAIISGNCASPNAGQPAYCNVKVEGDNPHTPPGQAQMQAQTYLIHLSSYYAPTTVTVSGFNCPGASPCAQVGLKGAQTVIDATGKAQNVLKRIQVRLPARNSYAMPEFDLETTNGICKQLVAYPPNSATGHAGQATTTCSGAP